MSNTTNFLPTNLIRLFIDKRVTYFNNFSPKKNRRFSLKKNRREEKRKKDPKSLEEPFTKPTREISRRDFSAESKEFLREEEEEEEDEEKGEGKNIGFLLIA